MKKITPTPLEEAMAPALAALKAELLRLHNVPGTDVDVYLWQPPPPEQWRVGVRVAEITFSKNGGGLSSMQCAPECFALLFAAERFLITHGDKPIRPAGFTEDIDEHAEALENLRYIWNKES
jgi:hypothetical protein